MYRLRIVLLFSAAVLSALLPTVSRTSAIGLPPAAPPPGVTPGLIPVLSGLSAPVYVTNARDTTNRLFVLELGGVIKVLQPGATSPTVFLDITTKVQSGGEQGLLGLAFHPQYTTNRRFFLHYTRKSDGANVVVEYKVSAANPNVADTTELVLLVMPQPFGNHNGGMIEFGPDGFLYIGKGDGGSGNDPGNRAQNVNELLGKVLRIDVDTPNGPVPYSSPVSNPFFGATPGRDEIYALGLRNPFRFSFDRETGQLFLGDVGQGAREEIDIVTLGGNYGWRVFEGTLCTNIDPLLCATPNNYIAPMTEYDHSGGKCSVTGGYVYRGALSTLPLGSYVFGDFCTGEIFLLDQGVATLLLDTSLNISSFGEDEAGEIYVVGLGGTVHRLINIDNLDGFHELADCQVISGWAWDSTQPNSPISVDIYDGTTLIATVVANQFRQDLVNSGKGNGNHGFSLATPVSLKDGQTHSIRVKFAGTSTDLSTTPRSILCDAVPVFEGFHDGADCQAIAGWAWDSNQPNSPINVDIYDGTTLIATVTANVFRQDLVNAGKGNGNHGFNFATPASLKDGQSHSIRVKFSGTNTDLFNTPKTINCSNAPPAPASSEGFHDAATCQGIAGWAWDSNQPNSPINVDIYDGTILIATVTANIFRQDLVNAGKGNGNHGFSFATPASLKDGQSHSIRVKFSGTNTDLVSTPKTINCGGVPPAPASSEGFHDAANCQGIAGWAWDSNQPNTPINVDIYDGTTLITTVTANIFRQDLVNAGKGNGNHGFSIATPAGLKNGQAHSIRVKFAGTSTDLSATPKSITCN